MSLTRPLEIPYLGLMWVILFCPHIPRFAQTYSHMTIYILQLVLQNLGKSNLIVRDTPKPHSFWEVERELPAQSGGRTLALGPGMQAKLTTAFLEPSMSAKVTVSSSPYKVTMIFFRLCLRHPKYSKWPRLQVLPTLCLSIPIYRRL